jgi:hypothetical protein
MRLGLKQGALGLSEPTFSKAVDLAISDPSFCPLILLQFFGRELASVCVTAA